MMSLQRFVFLLLLPLLATSSFANDTSSTPEATVQFFNRDIAVLRTTIAGYPPSERAKVAAQRIELAVAASREQQIAISPGQYGLAVQLNGRAVFHIAPADANPLTGETPEELAAQAHERLADAITQYVAQRDAKGFIHGFIRTVLVLLAFFISLRAIFAANRWFGQWLARKYSAQDENAVSWNHLLLPKIAVAARRLAHAITILCAFLLAYAGVVLILDSFPFTQPWSTQLKGFFEDLVSRFVSSALVAIPGLVTVALIVWLASWVVRASNQVFHRIEQGEIALSLLDRDMAAPTRKIVAVLLWLFALAMAYPYIPGAQTEAFKGLSVLAGLMISIGASSLVGQAASGLILVYARAFRVGEYVRIGDNEGSIAAIGLFTTRLRTGFGVEISLPNANVLSNAIRNYSRALPGSGSMFETSLTIGYDTPWRQVHRLLREAAAQINEIRQDPAPEILQTALSDFYVEYRFVGHMQPEAGQTRAQVLSCLHAAILDSFNRHGVQIMSPHYMADPATEKLAPFSEH